MIVPEKFLIERKNRGLPGTASANLTRSRNAALTNEVRQTANRGLVILPVSEFARLAGNPDLLIGEATSDIHRLEGLAHHFQLCTWRVAIGPSHLCVLQVNGPIGRASIEALSRDQGECLTLWSQRGDMAWAFFRWPTGLVLRASAKKVAPGVRILGPGESCPVPPSVGCAWSNPWAEIEAVPYWLRERAFEPPECPPGRAVTVPEPPRPARCRSTPRLERPLRGARKGYPTCNQAEWRSGFRISNRQ